MTFDVVTLFPGMFGGVLADGVLGRARRGGRIAVRLHDLRRFGLGRQRQVDDKPFGGGRGMVLRPEPLFAAVEHVRARHPARRDRVVLLSPQGPVLDHKTARRLAAEERVILLCGRYEGVDERVREHLADEELSVGDFVLTGGEVPALMVIDAVARFGPGVLGDPAAAEHDSFADGRLEPPYYTRPAEFRGHGVPAVLLSGDHAAIARWREDSAGEVTARKRPDLLEGGRASDAPEGER